MPRKLCLEYIQRKLLKVPGVYAVGLGDRDVREIIINVEYKHDRLDDIIAELGIDNARIRRGTRPRPATCGCYFDTCRPVEAGVAVSDCSSSILYCGSAGPFIEQSTNYVYLLTNAHCTRYIHTCDINSVGGKVAQPGGSCAQDYYIGTIAKIAPIVNNGKLDTALIAPSSLDIVSNKVHKLSDILGQDVYFNGQIATPSAGTTIYKSGPRTGAQSCSVVATHVSVAVDYSIVRNSCLGTVVITNTINTTKCGDSGDSGSLAVLSDGTFVGQFFAFGDTDSYFISGESIRDELGIVPYTQGGVPPPPPRSSTQRTVQCTLI